MRPGRRMPRALTALVLMLAGSAHAQSSSTTVLHRADVAPYHQVLQGLRRAAEDPLRLVDLSRGAPRAVAGDGPILALGRTALHTALRARSRGRKVLFAMVNNPWPMLEGEAECEGISMNVDPVAQLGELLRLAPEVKRVGVIYDPAQSRQLLPWLEAAAAHHQVRLVSREAPTAGAAVARLADLADEMDALWMVPDTTVTTPAFLELALTLSFERRMPVLTFSRRFVESGALLSLDVVPEQVGVQLADLLDSARSGPARVHPVRDYALVINAATLRRLGLRAPEEAGTRAEMLGEGD